MLKQGYFYPLTATVDGQPIVFIEVSTPRDPSRRYFDVYTDRLLYRPGETVRWKVLVRDRRDGKFTLPSTTAGWHYEVKLDNTDLVKASPLGLNAHGAFDGEFGIPPDARPGRVSLEITDEHNETKSVALPQVDRYVPPSVVAGVEMIGDHNSFRPGGQINVRVTARYFSGEPVVNAPVRLSLVGSRAFELYGTEYWDRFETWMKNQREHPAVGSTNTQGTSDLAISLPPFPVSRMDLDVAASVQPEGAAAAIADTSVTITRAGYVLHTLNWAEPRLVRPHDPVTFGATVGDGAGRPTAFAGIAQLVEIRWSEVWIDAKGSAVPEADVEAAWIAAGGDYSKLPKRWTPVHAGYLESVVAEAPVSARSDGRIAPTFTLPRAGIFRVRLMTDSGQEIAASYATSDLFETNRTLAGPKSRRKEASAGLCVIAADEHTTSLAFAPETQAVLVAPPTEAGQPVRTVIIAPAGIARGWISLCGETQIESSDLDFQGRVGWKNFAHPPRFFGKGSVHVSYAGLKAGSTAEFTAPTDSKELHLSIRPSQNEQRPGTAAKVTIVAQDAASHPVANAEVAVSVADEAVDSMVGPAPSRQSSTFLTAENISDFDCEESISPTVELRPERDSRVGAICNPVGIKYRNIGAYLLDQRSAFLVGRLEQPEMLYDTAIRRKVERYDSAVSEEDDIGVLGLRASEPMLSDVIVRRHFASTAYWSPSLTTDSRGEARFSFNYPDNLTQWRMGAYTVGADGNSFGTGMALARTSLPFQARLPVPRCLVSGDTMEATATLLNRSDGEVRANAELKLEGPAILSNTTAGIVNDIVVPRQAEAHPTWTLGVNAPGPVGLTLTARTGSESDGITQTVPVREDGISQETASVRSLTAGNQRSTCSLTLAGSLDPERTHVTVQLSPSPAVAVIDALPYLIDYPYGCVEQTMSRFLPAIAARKTLVDLGLSAAAVEKRILATESPTDSARRIKTAGLPKLDDVVKASVARLADAQLNEGFGGFGWWPQANGSDLWMTAYVIWGLRIAEGTGVHLPAQLEDNLDSALRGAILDVNVYDDRTAFAFAALAQVHDAGAFTKDEKLMQHFQTVYAARDHLSAYGRACLAMAAPVFATPEQRAILVRNLDNGVERVAGGDFGELAHWGKTNGYWRATDGAVETTALTLMALLELDPKNPLIEPAANWLLLNRRGIHWSNTRETAFAVLALTRYLHDRGGLDASGEFDVLVNGAPVQHVKFAPGALLETPLRVEVPGKFLRPGENQIELRRTAGTSPVYLVAFATSWVSGSEVKPAGSLVHVRREYIHQKAEPTLVGTLRITPEPLGANGTAVAGNEVLARVTIDCPSELEYVMVEVPKPAGCEPLNPLSGWDAHLVRPDDKGAPDDGSDENEAKQGRAIYREEYDDKSVFFIDHLEAGRSEIRFGMRATTRGDFRALPAKVEAMYAPEIRANSDARRLTITPAP